MNLKPNRFESERLQSKSDQISSPSKNPWQYAWQRYKKNHLAMLSLIVLGLLILFAFVGPLISRYNYFATDLDHIFLTPSWIHPFGTDDLGRDIMTRIMYGGRISLVIGFISVLINLVIGVTYGAVSGYFGGSVDNVMMRAVDIIYCVPDLLYIILIMVVFGQGGLLSVIIVLGIINWTAMARIVRGQILSIKEREYVLAARALGANTQRVLVKHLIPNTMGPIIVTVALQIPTAIFMEAFISFIGIGIMPPQVSWGSMAAAARQSIPSHPNLLLFPSLAIAVTMLALNFIGDGLRDVFDPQMK